MLFFFQFGKNKENMRMSRAAQNLCFHKKLCQTVFILIREFKQLAESVCVCMCVFSKAHRC